MTRLSSDSSLWSRERLGVRRTSTAAPAMRAWPALPRIAGFVVHTTGPRAMLMSIAAPFHPRAGIAVRK